MTTETSVKALQEGLEKLFRRSGLTAGERLFVIARLMRVASTGLVPLSSDAEIAAACQELSAGMDEFHQQMLQHNSGGYA